MVDFWEMNNQAMEVDAEKLSSRQFNWFFNYMCYKESKLKALMAPLVVDNCMLRYLAKEKINDRSENFKKQESMISKQACLLPDATYLFSIKFLYYFIPFSLI
jgi:hypothetical protein